MSQHPHHLVAIDLGASSGRVVLGTVAGGRLSMEVVHRFEHAARPVEGHLRWDWPGIIEDVWRGLAAAARQCGQEHIASVSCSSWAQDFGLLDESGQLMWPPVSYRDGRTAGMPEEFAQIIAPDDLIRRVGCGRFTVTTLCQCRAMSRQEPDVIARARTLLFIADLVHWALCGGARRTSPWHRRRNSGTSGRASGTGN
jgi:rhamnulokinase